MRCIAVIEANRPGLDSVIVWQDQDRLVAYAYQDGKVSMTRPLDAQTIDAAVQEIRDNFQINDGQYTRLTDWTATSNTTTAATLEPVTRRWGA